MSIMLMLAACGGQELTTKTYTNSQTVTIPAGVGNITLASGQGAAGVPEVDYYVEQYSDTSTVYNQRNDQGGTINTLNGGTTYGYGPVPSDYCTEHEPYFTNGVTNYTWTCHTYADTGYWDTEAATTGSAATGFGKTFPGGVGGPATPVTFENVAVVGGQSYALNIPSGGSITISYYE